MDQVQILPQTDRSREYFDSLTRDEKVAAIRQLASQGFGDYDIAAATRLSVDAIRQSLGTVNVATQSEA